MNSGDTTDYPHRKKMKVDSIFMSYTNINYRSSKYLQLKDTTYYMYTCVHMYELFIHAYTNMQTFISRTP